MCVSLDQLHDEQYAPVNVFPQRWGGGITPGNWTILKNWGLILYSYDTILCP